MNRILTGAEFLQQVEEGRAALTLVGMSNAGKSWISARLEEEQGFERISVDDLIEDGLEPVLKELGYKGIEDVAEWMGQPYEPQSPENQRAYLSQETQIMEGIISRLEGDELENNLVIDTTGSVVHTGPKICKDLGRLSTVVCLDAGEDAMSDMFDSYVANPKPVVWEGIFRQGLRETPEEALANCYPRLLEHRRGLYLAMADVVIPRQSLMEVDGEEFLNRVASEFSV